MKKPLEDKKECVCSKCGHRFKPPLGTPCFTLPCPRCEGQTEERVKL